MRSSELARIEQARPPAPPAPLYLVRSPAEARILEVLAEFRPFGLVPSADTIRSARGEYRGC